VEGRIFHRNALQALAGNDSDVRGMLVGLVRKELVRPDRARFPGDEAYRFRHLLIRDAAYDALPKALRAEMHEAFAGWLDEHGNALPELDEIVGYHLERAARYRQELGQPDMSLAERAGERLAQAALAQKWGHGDDRTAEGLLERALSLLRPLRWSTYLEMELLDTRRLPPEEQAAAYETIADRARDAGDLGGETVARSSAARQRIWAGSRESVEVLEAMARGAIPALESTNDIEGLFQLWYVLRDVAHFKGRFEEATRASEQMIRYGRQLGRPGTFLLPAALPYGPRPVEECLRILEPLAADNPHPHPPLVLAHLRAQLGQLEGARAAAQAAAGRLNELSGDILGMGVVAKVMELEGDHEAAVEELRRFCKALEERGEVGTLSTFYPVLGRELCRLGRYDEAESLARRGREIGADDDVSTQAIWRQVMALALAHRGEHAEAESLAREAVAIAAESDALDWQGGTLYDLAEVLIEAGRPQEAAETLEEALERYSRKQILVMAARVRDRLAALAGKSADPVP
jgi:tetratricopeptide (TPR) repeat protein